MPKVKMTATVAADILYEAGKEYEVNDHVFEIIKKYTVGNTEETIPQVEMTDESLTGVKRNK